MATLFEITCIRASKVKGTQFLKLGTVQPVPSDFAGFVSSETGEIVRPDIPAIRNALPHYLRRAFDRSQGRFRFPSSPGESNKYTVASLRLYGSSGDVLAYLYARIYTLDLGRTPTEREAREIGAALA